MSIHSEHYIVASQAMSAEEMSAAKNELNRGFTSPLKLDDFADNARLAVPVGAYTAPTGGVQTARELLLDTLRRQSDGGEQAAQAAAAATAAATAEAVASPQKDTPPAPEQQPGPADPSTRNLAKKNLTMQLKKIKTKAMAAVVAAAEQLEATTKSIAELSLEGAEYTDFTSTLRERMLCVEAWLGGQVAKDKDDKTKEPEIVLFTYLKAAEDGKLGGAPQGQEAPPVVASLADVQKEKVQRHQTDLDQAIKDLTWQPLESAQDLRCYTGLDDDIHRLAGGVDAAVLEERNTTMNKVESLMKQLLESLKVATRDLRSAVQKDARGKQQELEANGAEAEARSS